MRLTREERNGMAVWTDPGLREQHGIVVAFSERRGGVSDGPYATLNLAAHVGDDARDVDANRERLLRALGLWHARDALTCAEQVHGASVGIVAEAEAGAGARAGAVGRPSVPGVDALVTARADTPLMLLFADCVPVILVRTDTPAIAVVHAGWRGALSGIVGAAARALSGGDAAAAVSAYIGPHIGVCCYEVGDEVLSQFRDKFVTLSAASGRLDLGAAVAEDLVRAGVSMERQSHLGLCTADNTDTFYSYRAEGRLTGRHCAVAAILGASL